MEYRRLKHKDTWHFMPNCQHWKRMELNPGTYVSVDLSIRGRKRPSYGELCNECLGKEKRSQPESVPLSDD